MQHKWILGVCILLIGCGNELSVGITKGGTGSGGPLEPDPKPPIQSNNGEKLSDQHWVWLSKPISDYCNGVKRTLYFLDPYTEVKINSDQRIHINQSVEVIEQLKVKVVWENDNHEVKSVQRLKDFTLIDFEEFWQQPNDQTGGGIGIRNAVNDYEQIDLNAHSSYESETYRYRLVFSSQGEFIHSHNVVFSLNDQINSSCTKLSIEYFLQNYEQ